MTRMSERDPRLMPIGTFSATTRLSVKALRLYDEQGLLRPERVDQFTGYRYYALAQVPRAEAIRLLRSVDMPLDEIARVLAANPETRSRLMVEHLERLEAGLAAQQQRIAAFTELVEGRKPLMPYEISQKELGDQHVASVSSEVTLEGAAAAVSGGFGAIMGALETAGVAPAGAPFLVLHDVIDAENPGTIEACVPVAGPFQPAAPVVSKHLPGGLAACTVHKGAYQEVAPAYHALSAWMSTNGWEPSGPPREVYLNDPTTVPVGELLTEVVWPMRQQGA
jgi:DNA-binding transcriptional MerR regulator